MSFTENDKELQCFTSGLSEISGFRQGVVQALYFLGCYTAYIFGCLPKLQNSLQAPVLRLKKKGRIRSTYVDCSLKRFIHHDLLPSSSDFPDTCYYYYYFFYLYFYHLCAGCLQLYTSNKPIFQRVQCCCCCVFTICATCNIISHADCNALLQQHFPKQVYCVEYGCFFVVARYVTQELSV